MKELVYTVKDGFEGERILKFLKEEAHLSSALIKRAKIGGVFVDGRNVHMREILHTGQTVTVRLDEKGSSIRPIDIPLNILYEDDWLIAVSKPQNMPTHPSRGNSLPTLAEALAAYFKEDFVFRAAGRLDRDTSGVVIVAKNQHSAGKLCESMKAGRFIKKYTALVCGTPSSAEGTVDAPIARESEGNMKRCVREDGKRAVTDYRVLAEGGGLSLCELMPKTGRTHQIRVHMAYIGHPLYNDFLYGERVRDGSYFLHAAEISFPHPITDEYMTVRCEAPFDLNTVAQKAE